MPDETSKPKSSAARPKQEPSAEKIAAEALQTAGRAVQSISSNVGMSRSQSVELPEFSDSKTSGDDRMELDVLDDVNLNVRIELGRTRLYVEDVLRLNSNSIVELDKAVDDPVDVFVNDQLIARGELVVLDDHFCVRVTEIVSDSNE